MKKVMFLVGTIGLLINLSLSSIVLLKDTIQNYDQNNNEVYSLSNKNNTSLGMLNNNEFNKEIKELETTIDFQSLTDFVSSKTSITERIFACIDNTKLSNDFIVNIVGSLLKSFKFASLESVKYLSYFKFDSNIVKVFNDLAQDWSQQSDYDDIPINAMRKFINSKEGDIAQAKWGGSARKKGQWYNVVNRSKKWDWTTFYLYMAGVNLNFVFKKITGKYYIGDLISKHVHWGFTRNQCFDQKNFLNEFSCILKEIQTNEEVWPYLIKAVVPILKYEILNVSNPTLGFKNLTWEKTSEQDLSLKFLLTKIKYLISPEGYNDFVNLISNFLKSSFGEDIIIDCKIGYFTIPEIFEIANSWWASIFIRKDPTISLAEKIVNQFSQITNNLNWIDNIDSFIERTEKGLTENFNINTEELCDDLKKLVLDENFTVGLNRIFDIINNPKTSLYSLKEILKMWGVQKNKEDFRTDSPLAIIKKWIDDSDSILNKIFNVIRNLENSSCNEVNKEINVK